MSLFKDDATMRLDDVNLAAAEAAGLYADLLERIEDTELHRLVSNHLATQDRLVEQIADLRRNRGELPQAADPERSHLEAAGAYLRAIVLPGETIGHYVESMLDAAAAVATQIDNALSLDLDGELPGLLKEFSRVNAAYETELRAIASRAGPD